MEFDFKRIDLVTPAEIERSAGTTALLVQKRLEAGGLLPSTFLLGRKAFRLASDRLPSGHRPVELCNQQGESGREERAARAFERMRRSVDLVPTLSPKTDRCLVWSSAVVRPRRRSWAGLLAVIEAPTEQLALAVTELWAAVFLEPVLDRAPGRLRRLELAVGVTEDEPLARAALLDALGQASGDGGVSLPAPGQAVWPSAPLAFDRSLERLRADARRSALKRAFGKPTLALSMGPRGPGLDGEQVQALIERQSGGIGGAVARDVVGPLELGPEVAMGGERALDLARLGAQLALHVAQMAELGREVERLAAQAQGRHDWLVEMDLALLPDDGLKTTLAEQLALVPAVSDLALRACLASARLSRTYSAFSGGPSGELDLGVRFPLLQLLSDFEAAASELLRGGPIEAAAAQVADRHLEVFPRFDAGERRLLAQALREVARQGTLGPSVERRIEMARVRGDEVAAAFESRLPRLLASRLSPLRSLVQGACQLRERARQLEILADAMLRTVALEVDRRLPRLEPGLPDGAVWHCQLSEILETVDLRGTSLAARVSARSRGEAGYQAATNLVQPRLLGAQGESVPIPLARTRALDQLAWLLVAPDRVSYRGRSLDTLPSLARALDVPLSA